MQSGIRQLRPQGKPGGRVGVDRRADIRRNDGDALREGRSAGAVDGHALHILRGRAGRRREPAAVADDQAQIHRFHRAGVSIGHLSGHLGHDPHTARECHDEGGV